MLQKESITCPRCHKTITVDTPAHYVPNFGAILCAECIIKIGERQSAAVQNELTKRGYKGFDGDCENQ